MCGVKLRFELTKAVFQAGVGLENETNQLVANISQPYKNVVEEISNVTYSVTRKITTAGFVFWMMHMGEVGIVVVWRSNVYDYSFFYQLVWSVK